MNNMTPRRFMVQDVFKAHGMYWISVLYCVITANLHQYFPKIIVLDSLTRGESLEPKLRHTQKNDERNRNVPLLFMMEGLIFLSCWKKRENTWKKTSPG